MNPFKKQLSQILKTIRILPFSKHVTSKPFGFWQPLPGSMKVGESFS